MNTQTTKNKKNQKIPNSIARAKGGKVDRSFENLLTTAKLAKKPKITKFKKSNLVKINSARTDFPIFEAKKAFIYLQKVFAKALIFRHFDLKCYIWMKTDALKYIIGKVLSQITLDHLN